MVRTSGDYLLSHKKLMVLCSIIRKCGSFFRLSQNDHNADSTFLNDTGDMPEIVLMGKELARVAETRYLRVVLQSNSCVWN
jgi:hypothetical protein